MLSCGTSRFSLLGQQQNISHTERYMHTQYIQYIYMYSIYILRLYVFYIFIYFYMYFYVQFVCMRVCMCPCVNNVVLFPCPFFSMSISTCSVKDRVENPQSCSPPSNGLLWTHMMCHCCLCHYVPVLVLK